MVGKLLPPPDDELLEDELLELDELDEEELAPPLEDELLELDELLDSTPPELDEELLDEPLETLFAGLALSLLPPPPPPPPQAASRVRSAAGIRRSAVRVGLGAVIECVNVKKRQFY